MKKKISMLTCISICLIMAGLLSFSLAESIADSDLSALSIDDLILLRTQIDAELMSRPEVENSVLLEGEYTVGVDIKPGTYFITSNKSNNGWIGIEIYSDSTKSDEINDYTLQTSGYDIEKVTFADGQYIAITHGSILLNVAGFPDVKKPEGTEVQSGVYEVGTDIAAGKYTVYHGEGYAVASVYPDYNTFEEEKFGYLTTAYLEHNGEQTNIVLTEGNVLVIQGSNVIMTKSSGMLNIE